MKKNMRIIQISGLRGLLFAVFVVVCLAAGFIAFPALVAMEAWNYAANIFAIPAINIWQGLMLWAIIAISGYLTNKKGRYFVTAKSPKGLTEKELNTLIKRINCQQNRQNLDKLFMQSADLKSEEKTEKEKENI